MVLIACAIIKTTVNMKLPVTPLQYGIHNPFLSNFSLEFVAHIFFFPPLVAQVEITVIFLFHIGSKDGPNNFYHQLTCVPDGDSRMK
jgi:hypothetical protein